MLKSHRLASALSFIVAHLALVPALAHAQGTMPPVMNPPDLSSSISYCQNLPWMMVLATANPPNNWVADNTDFPSIATGTSLQGLPENVTYTAGLSQGCAVGKLLDFLGDEWRPVKIGGKVYALRCPEIRCNGNAVAELSCDYAVGQVMAFNPTWFVPSDSQVRINYQKIVSGLNDTLRLEKFAYYVAMGRSFKNGEEYFVTRRENGGIDKWDLMGDYLSADGPLDTCELTPKSRSHIRQRFSNLTDPVLQRDAAFRDVYDASDNFIKNESGLFYEMQSWGRFKRSSAAHIVAADETNITMRREYALNSAFFSAQAKDTRSHALQVAARYAEGSYVANNPPLTHPAVSEVAVTWMQTPDSAGPSADFLNMLPPP